VSQIVTNLDTYWIVIFEQPCTKMHDAVNQKTTKLRKEFPIKVHYKVPCCFTSCTPSRGRLRLKCDGTSAETRFRLSAKLTSPLKSAGASVQ